MMKNNLSLVIFITFVVGTFFGMVAMWYDREEAINDSINNNKNFKMFFHQNDVKCKRVNKE